MVTKEEIEDAIYKLCHSCEDYISCYSVWECDTIVELIYKMVNKEK